MKNKICVYRETVAIPDAYEHLVVPEKGDQVFLDIEGEVCQLKGDKVYINITAVNGEPLPKSESEKADDEEADLRRMAHE